MILQKLVEVLWLNSARPIRAFAKAIAFLLSLALASQLSAQSSWTWNGSAANWNNNSSWNQNADGCAGSSTRPQGYLNFGGSANTTANNDYAANSGAFRIYFNNGASSFTLTGNQLKFYDYGCAGNPLIQNDSSSLQTINLLFGIGNTSGGTEFDINANSGDITFGSSFAYFDDKGLPLTINASGRTVTFYGALNNGTAATKVVINSGTAVFTNGNSKYTGGTTVNGPNTVVKVSVASVTSGTTVSSGALGTNNLTLGDGTTLTMADSTARAIAFPQISIAGTVTLGQASVGTGALQIGGVWDLGGSPRTVHLAKTVTASGNIYSSGNASLYFSAPSGFIASLVQNGALTFDSPNASATTCSTIRFNTQTSFASNSGLTLGDGVKGYGGTGSFYGTGANAPALTLSAPSVSGGGVLDMGDNNGTAFNGGQTMRSPEVYSLAGGGTVSSANANAGWISTGTLTINNGNGATFSGNITEGANCGVIKVVKSGSTGTPTQTLSGNNNYSGLTTVSTGGTLKIGSANALGTGQNSTAYRNGGTAVDAGANSTTISSGGVLDLNGQSVTSDGYTVSGTGISSGGALVNSSSTLASLGGTSVNDVSLTAGGSWTSGTLTAPPSVTVNNTGTGGSGLTFGTPVVGIGSVTVTAGGSGYVASTISVSGGGGSGAVLAATTNSSGTVTAITVNNPGSGYTSPPTISFTTGSGGTFAPSLSVVALPVTSYGSGYNAAPTIAIDATGWASGATATATIPTVNLAADSSIGANSGDISISEPVTGNFNLTKVGNFALILSGANTYGSGKTTTLSAGTLKAANGSAFGLSSLALNAGTLDLANDTSVNAYNTTVGGAVTIASDKATPTSGGITHTLGTLSIGANTLSVTKGANVNDNNAGLTFGTTTLTTPGPAVFDVASGVNLTLGALGGAFNFTKQNSGTLTLNTTGTRGTSAGGTTLSAGTLRLGALNALNTASTGPLALNGGTLALAVDAGGTFNGTTMTLGGNTTIQVDRGSSGTDPGYTLGTLSMGAFQLSVTPGANLTANSAYGLTVGATTLTGNGVLDVANNGAGLGTVTIGNKLTGAYDFKKQGAGKVILNTALSSGNRPSGSDTLAAGTLVAGVPSALGEVGCTLNLNGGTLDLANGGINALNTTVGGDVTVLSDSSSATFQTHTLGVLSIDGHTLTVAPGSAVSGGSGTAALAFGATTLTGSPTFNITNINTALAKLTLGAITDNNSRTLTVKGNGSFAQSGAFAGNLGLSLDSTFSGTVSLSQANTYSGGTLIKGGTLVISGGDDRILNTSTVTLGDTSSSGTLQLADSSTARNQTLANLTTSGLGGSVVGGGSTVSTLTLNTVGTSTFSGTLGGTAANQNNLALTQSGTGTLILSGTNTYSGATTVSAGELAGATGGSCSNSAITVTSGATNGMQILAANGRWFCSALISRSGSSVDLNFGAISPSTTTAPLQVLGNLAFTNANIIVRYSGTLGVGQYPLIKYGGTLSGTLTGSTVTLPTLTSGAVATLVTNVGNKSIDLVVTVGNAFSWAVGNGNWDINGSANWNNSGINGFTYPDLKDVLLDDTASGASPILVTNSVVVSPTSMTNNSTKSYTIYGSAIAGSGSLTKSGTGVLTLANTNTYTGGTLITAGSLQLGDNATRAGQVAGAITNNAALVLGEPVAQTITNIILGSGSLTNLGAGAVTLTPSQTRTVSSSGTTTAVTMASTAGLLPGQGITGTGIQSGSYIVTIDSSTQITISGNATNLSSVTATITGNTYSGGTTITGGSVIWNVTSLASGTSVQSGALGTGNLTLSNGSTISSANGNFQLAVPVYNLAGNITVGSGAAVRSGLAGRWDLGGAARTITLGRLNAGLASGQECMRFESAGSIFPMVTNGSLTFNTSVASSALKILSPTSFTNNLSVTIGDGVTFLSGNGNFFITGLGAPALTLDADAGKGGGTFQMGDGINAGLATMRSAEIYSLSGAGTVSSTNTSGTVSTGTLTINNGNGATFSGSIIENAGVGIIKLTKTGAGIQYLSGVNTYSGATTISAGELIGVTGGSCANSPFTVSSGATNGVKVATANGQWICGGLTNSAGTTFADFDFGNVAPSTTTAPIQINGNFSAGSSVRVIVRNGSSWAPGVYPLYTWTGTGPGNLNNFAAPTLPSGAQGTLSINSSTISLNIGLLAPNLNYTNGAGTGLRILLSDITSNPGLQSSQGSPSYTITGVSATSTQGGTVAYNASTIQYTAPNSSVTNDTFTYTISDGAVSATATVTINFQLQASSSNPQLNVSGGTVSGTLYGIPGMQYDIQRKTNLVDTAWQTLSSPPLSNAPPFTADSAGRIGFTDTNPPPASGYYRTIQH